MVTYIGTFELSILITSHFSGLILKRSFSSIVKGLHKGPFKLFWVIAWISKDCETVLARLPTRQGNILCVNSNEVLGVTNTGPAAVIHVTRSFATSNHIQIQSVPCPVLWLHRGTTDCTKSTEHVRELLVRHFMAPVEQELTP